LILGGVFHQHRKQSQTLLTIRHSVCVIFLAVVVHRAVSFHGFGARAGMSERFLC
jgi:hypothetical protein